MHMVVCVDFDGTIVEHCYPDIGKLVPGAIECLRRLQDLGVRLILWTMRSDGGPDGQVLSDAVNFCRKHGVSFFGINGNPEQASWTNSPKAYGHAYVDDAAIGCPLIHPYGGGRPYVDWRAVEQRLMALLDGERFRKSIPTGAEDRVG